MSKAVSMSPQRSCIQLDSLLPKRKKRTLAAPITLPREAYTIIYIAFSEDRYFSFGLVRIDTSVLG